jgi:hypothetical protein
VVALLELPELLALLELLELPHAATPSPKTAAMIGITTLDERFLMNCLLWFVNEAIGTRRTKRLRSTL